MTDDPIRTPTDADADRWQLVDLIALVWRRRGVAATTFSVIIVATVIALLVAEKQFTARATFVPPPESGVESLSSALRNPISAIIGGTTGGSIDRLLGYLDSQTARRGLVERFGLMEHYKQVSVARAVRQLESSTHAIVSPEGVVSVRVTDSTPAVAADLANGYVDFADSLFRESQRDHAGQLRRFLETRVEQNRRDLESAEERSRVFSQTHGVVALPEQVGALIDRIAQVEAEIGALDVRIGAASQIFGPDHVSVRQDRVERTQLAAQRRQLLGSRGGGADPLLRFGDVPDRVVEYYRLQRELRIQTLIQELILQQYEMAKMDEARNVSSLSRIDRAVPPELKSWPPRGRLLVLSGVMAMVWAVILAWFVDRWPRMRDRIVSKALHD